MGDAAPVTFRADPADARRAAPLDAFTAVYHRRSGITHLLTEPAPQILAILSEHSLSLDALLTRLSQDYDLADPTRDALAARLDELIVAGLVTAS